MSYYRVLGLIDEPFSTSPDPQFFYESRNHKSVLANLMIDLRLKRGLSVVTGEVGTGKTTLGRKLVQMLKDREGFTFHLILDPSFANEESLLSALTQLFRLPLPETQFGLLPLKQSLEQYLFKTCAEEGKTVVLIFDEAQKMNPQSLEILRMLLNYETNSHKLLQIILFAQTEIMPVLHRMPNLMDRVSLKCNLEPLEENELGELIEFRIRQAGFKGRNRLFREDAVREIYRYSRGYPRKTAMVCHRALKTLVMYNEEFVTGRMIQDLINQDVRAGWMSESQLQKNSF